MKKTLIILLYILTPIIAIANSKDLGKIYTKDGNILNVEISVYAKGIILSENKIRYFENGTKKKISLSKIKRIELDSKTYEIITSYSKERKTGPSRGVKKFTLLAEIISNGKVKLYKVYGLASSGHFVNGINHVTGSYLSEGNYLVKGEIVKHVSKLGFKRTIKKFFPECEINQKLKDKVYGYKDIKAIIDLGNKICKTN